MLLVNCQIRQFPVIGAVTSYLRPYVTAIEGHFKSRLR